MWLNLPAGKVARRIPPPCFLHLVYPSIWTTRITTTMMMIIDQSALVKYIAVPHLSVIWVVHR